MAEEKRRRLLATAHEAKKSGEVGIDLAACTSRRET
jgi:hypothetical protein